MKKIGHEQRTLIFSFIQARSGSRFFRCSPEPFFSRNLETFPKFPFSGEHRSLFPKRTFLRFLANTNNAILPTHAPIPLLTDVGYFIFCRGHTAT